MDTDISRKLLNHYGAYNDHNFSDQLSVMHLNRITLLDGYWYKSEIA